MSADLSLDAEERLIEDAVGRFCAANVTDARLLACEGRLDRSLFASFAELGFFALASDDASGCARAVVVVVEGLGRALFPGPVVDTFLAVHVCDEPLRASLIEGRAIASSGQPPLLPFACEADVHFDTGQGGVHLIEPIAALTPVSSLGAEPFGRGAFRVVRALPRAAMGLALADLALASYLAAAASTLLARTAEHVASRKQFGRPVGSFQAVAHPLANCHIALSAACALTRAGACALDEGDATRGPELVAAALVSSRRAALDTAYVCHQKLGAIGITLEGPAHRITRRLRQLATRAQQRSRCSHPLLARYGVDP